MKKMDDYWWEMTKGINCVYLERKNGKCRDGKKCKVIDNRMILTVYECALKKEKEGKVW